MPLSQYRNDFMIIRIRSKLIGQPIILLYPPFTLNKTGNESPLKWKPASFSLSPETTNVFLLTMVDL